MAITLIRSGKTITIRDDELDGITSGDPETTYTVRQIEPERMREIRKRNTKFVATRQGREEKVDADALLDDIVDEVLVAWTGILDNGQPAELTRDHKLLLDYPRKMALIGVAGTNEIQRQAEKEQSFRGPQKVVSSLG
jgi:hypothetical protein